MYNSDEILQQKIKNRHLALHKETKNEGNCDGNMLNENNTILKCWIADITCYYHFPLKTLDEEKAYRLLLLFRSGQC